MRTVTRTEFKQWQALPVLSLAERENRPLPCETGRPVSGTAPRKSQACRMAPAPSAEKTGPTDSPREAQQP